MPLQSYSETQRDLKACRLEFWGLAFDVVSDDCLQLLPDSWSRFASLFFSGFVGVDPPWLQVEISGSLC